MTKLPAARPSPRVAGGVLRWYAGDTFKVTLRLELQDQDGEAVTVGAGNCVTLVFDETVNAKFPQGAYRYDILYTHGDKTTLARGNCAAAE